MKKFLLISYKFAAGKLIKESSDAVQNHILGFCKADSMGCSVSEEQINVMMKQAKEILDDYENFSIPKWVDEIG